MEALYLTKFNNAIIDLGMTQFEKAKSSTKNEYLRGQGIEDDSIMKSLGIIAFSLAILIFIFPIYLLISLCNRRFRCFEKIKTMIAKKLFYSGPLRYIVVGYLKLFNQFASLLCVALIEDADSVVFI